MPGACLWRYQNLLGKILSGARDRATGRTGDDIRACLAYARALVANEDLSAVRVEGAR